MGGTTGSFRVQSQGRVRVCWCELAKTGESLISLVRGGGGWVEGEAVREATARGGAWQESENFMALERGLINKFERSGYVMMDEGCCDRKSFSGSRTGEAPLRRFMDQEQSSMQSENYSDNEVRYAAVKQPKAGLEDS